MDQVYSGIAMAYFRLIIAKRKTLEDVPTEVRPEVEALIENYRKEGGDI